MTKPEINVTPLIDVLLVLLIIFMIISPVSPSSFKTKVPGKPLSDGQPPVANPDTLIVTVGQDTGLSLNSSAGLGSVNEPEKLIENLRKTFAGRVKNYGPSAAGETAVPRSVFIRAPRKLDYGSVVKVIDAIKISGAEPIALLIDDVRE